MAEITLIDKTPAVPEKVKGATLKFTAEELVCLQTALEAAYKAHQANSASHYLSPTAVRLHRTVKAARAGEYAPLAGPTLQDALRKAYTPYITAAYVTNNNRL